jgi:hypothetical protein
MVPSKEVVLQVVIVEVVVIVDLAACYLQDL